ncbi:MAG: hypothetical protein KJ672_01755 [Candidatus Thermoplasmatota archaeon]|nr:hypothetical protein [Candidatus Thermoplasmatota archaeon]
MEPALLDILREALATKQRKETLERAIGKAVRRSDLDFGVYIKIMSELRELSKKGQMDLEDIAESLVSVNKKNS